MIDRLIVSQVPRLIQSLIGNGEQLFSVGVLLVSSDGDALFTTDNALLTLGGPQAQSARRPEVLLFTTDNATLYTTDNDTLTV